MIDEERDQQTTEVRNTKERQGNTTVQRQSVTTASKVDMGVVAKRIVYYIFGVIVALLALRIVLLLLAANKGSGFVDFTYWLSGIFAWPFYGVFNYQPSYGQSVFELSSVVAIVVYALIAVGLAKLFTLNSKSADVE